MSDEESQKIQTEDRARVHEHLNALSEHFDSVQIFVTRHESGRLDGTIRCELGAGNWFARYGQVKDWVTYTEERTRADVRKEERE